MPSIVKYMYNKENKKIMKMRKREKFGSGDVLLNLESRV